VNASEVETARLRLENQAGSVELGLPVGLVYLNDAKPAQTWGGVALDGAEGAVSSNAQVVTRWTFLWDFQPDPEGWILEFDTVNRSREGYIRLDRVDVRIDAPPGHVVAATGGLPWGARVHEGAVMFPYDGPAGRVRIAFEEGAQDLAARDTPGIHPLLVAALLPVVRRLKMEHN